MLTMLDFYDILVYKILRASMRSELVGKSFKFNKKRVNNSYYESTEVVGGKDVA